MENLLCGKSSHWFLYAHIFIQYNVIREMVQQHSLSIYYIIMLSFLVRLLFFVHFFFFDPISFHFFLSFWYSSWFLNQHLTSMIQKMESTMTTQSITYSITQSYTHACSRTRLFAFFKHFQMILIQFFYSFHMHLSWWK